MLSIAISFISYYFMLFLIGAMVKSIVLEGSLIVFATICFIGAYLARSSRFVRRMAYWFGGACCAILAFQWLILPFLTKSLVIVLATFVGFAAYVLLRRPIHRRLLRRDRDGNRPRPPFGREWVRWLIAFGL